MRASDSNSHHEAYIRDIRDYEFPPPADPHFLLTAEDAQSVPDSLCVRCGALWPFHYARCVPDYEPKANPPGTQSSRVSTPGHRDAKPALHTPISSARIQTPTGRGSKPKRTPLTPYQRGQKEFQNAAKLRAASNPPR